MAWNGSDQSLPSPRGRGASSASRRPAARQPNNPTVLRGLLAGLLVVVLAGAALWYIFIYRAPATSRTTNHEPRTTSHLIAEHKPDLRTNAVPEKVKEPEMSPQEKWKKAGHKRNPWGTPIPKDLEYKPHWLYTAEDYARVDPGYKRRHERFLAEQAKIPWSHPCECDLAQIIFTKPGDPLLYTPLSDDFKDQFVRSLATPIIISKDDPPEVAEQKQQMIDVKIYLKDRMDAGDDIVKLLEDERKNIADLNGFRDNLESELREMERDAKSEADIEDFVKAANIMLKERGIGEVHLPISETRLRLRQGAAERGEKVKDLSGESSSESEN